MARYVTKVLTDRPPDEVFDYMADLRHLAQWDPGTSKVVQIEGDGGGPGTVFDVTARNGIRDITLRYVCETYSRPEHLVVVATSRLFRAEDQIRVAPSPRGTILTYEAELRLRGPLAIADPLLQRSFNRIGDRAAAGLLEVLDGRPVES